MLCHKIMYITRSFYLYRNFFFEVQTFFSQQRSFHVLRVLKVKSFGWNTHSCVILNTCTIDSWNTVKANPDLPYFWLSPTSDNIRAIVSNRPWVQSVGQSVNTLEFSATNNRCLVSDWSSENIASVKDKTQWPVLNRPKLQMRMYLW